MTLMISICIGCMCILLFLPSLRMGTLKRTLTQMNQTIRKKQNLKDGQLNALIRFAITVGMAFMGTTGLGVSIKQETLLRERMERGGLHRTIDPKHFQAIKWGLVILFSSYGLVMYFFTSGLVRLFVSLLPVISFIWPDLWLKERMRNREHQIRSELPFALNSIAIMTDAGLDLFQAIGETCRMKNGVLINELNRMLGESQSGFSRKDALLRMGDRLSVAEVSLFTSALSQALDKGASGITLVLKQQADELWNARKYSAKELAEKASMKLFMPMLLLVLPALLIYLLAPAGFILMDFMAG